MYKLKTDDIKSWVSKNSYTRGRRYFLQDMVDDLSVMEVDDDEVILEASVHGSLDYPYEQSISIFGFASGEIQIDGDCSCPVSFNCKHVVAACLKYKEKPGRENPSKLSPSLCWLDQFVNAGGTGDPLETADKNFIVYILTFSSDTAALTVKPEVTRVLKKGGLGKSRALDLFNLTALYLRPAYARASDQEISRLVLAQEKCTVGYQTYLLSGELGFLALSKMLNSGRCFWLDTSGQPILQGEPRELQLNWRNDKNNDRHLQIKVQPEAKVLNTTPALYIDYSNSQAAVIGPLRGADFNAKQWSMLLNAPVVPAGTSSEFSVKLLTRLTDHPLPAPQQMASTTIEDQLPVPHLYLFTEKDASSGQVAHVMRLRFAYAGYELAYAPITPVRKLIDNNKIISIHRDLVAEQSAHAELNNAGFQGSVNAQTSMLAPHDSADGYSPPIESFGADSQLVTNNQSGDLILMPLVKNNLIDAIACWQHFLEDVLPKMEDDGWIVQLASDFHLQFLSADDWKVEIDGDNDWFNLRFDLDIQGRKLQLLPLIVDVMNNYELDNLPEILILPLGDGQYLQLPSSRIHSVCQTLYELYDSTTLDADGNMRLNRFDAARLAELEENCGSELKWRGGKAMRNLGRKLKNFKGIRDVAKPRGLKATLRSYQQQGLNWLQFLRIYEFNGILADDMGLGKTVQTLAHLLKEKESKRMDKPCLIIAPTSLMSNWRREVQQFTPKLSVLVLQGPQRQQYFDTMDQYDLIISTYPLLVRDEEILLAQKYHYLILDEAQVIKNPRAKAARVVRKITARHRLCLTGTPMENHLGELWALYDFLMPGFLGDSKSFGQRFRAPIEKQGDTEQRQRLVRRVAPFLLRRTKGEVLSELPDKTEIIRSVSLANKQAALYESIRLSMEKKVRDAIANKGLARSHITILDALLKLRQVCCDPRLLSLAQAKKVKDSAKLEMLMKMLPEMLEEGRRILIFSQFTKMLEIIEQKLYDNNINYTKLTGQTRKRDQVIEQFRRGEADVFLISLKAGGVGLNLTEADTVIHYDPWWNPAVENQATDRTHRIGQKKAVFVYKLITENTLEEKIISMQARKRKLAEGVYKQGKQSDTIKFNADDLQELFSPLFKTKSKK